MPSRKKAKGKARRAARVGKEEESQIVVPAANQRQEGSLEVMMQRLIFNSATPQYCKHGLASSPSTEEEICLEFIHTFIEEFTSKDGVVGSVTAAIEATLEATQEKFDDVYYSSKLETVVSILLASGTQLILDGDKHNARLYAVLAYFFQQWMEVQVKESKAICIWSKVYELHVADDHTLIQYYRKRISCSCLDKKYEEVKSVKKMGLCYNPKCSLPGRKMQRSKMFYCTRCCEVNYCSVECQKNDWKKHRQFCNRIVAKKAAFNTSKQS
ncbi:hypothetical protein QTG54_012832 [Skeletonema marinoi]|uniref:MYND-type domain-containing protein n=1 Tax=Skeletonema marinoi TaxID=267567 RepID=A0AAD8XYT1_9STRA|nr:hypothetical protein QTG54_012832 [Skeletonema marinoi]|mmetsp:Transcript_23358/g.46514  ORF Transcript_23358/g.46514 Transcript_23358/m.46514 type:complete len:270 (-) Transcript_23358:139-948(-)|eukprot:CAMPEP_0113410764 /NCGR_PEP_ID=MMETSP0013_2-20120614/21886_1 /TAXON_ID=2843 ORGANISM="Skeletonema costatum, Strain 1716" /NCGR_SAMPLE_ID=MMETSP0013_2 /ASSEMBLY_ACC=CAM_ASM_000158 /LENGTH=269 /DNA_ID=CAMNT_0000297033 /DNA_START=65 /DNA_END=874 /DNA_ORIENTATION=+ /assembly_acc=CAM_ASM_000158